MLTLPALGACQCGACRYELSAQAFVTYTCHCKECQRLTGSAFLSCIQVPSEALRFSQGEPVSHSRLADSGNTLTHWFCAQCSSMLYAQSSARPRIKTVSIGTLEQPQDAKVNAHIWTQSKLSWVNLPDSHRQFAKGGDWSVDYAEDMERYKPAKKA